MTHFKASELKFSGDKMIGRSNITHKNEGIIGTWNVLYEPGKLANVI